MKNLYAIDNRLYSYKELENQGLVGEEEYTYIEPDLVDLGNDIFLVLDNEAENFELLGRENEDIYHSLTVNSTSILEEVLKELL